MYIVVLNENHETIQPQAIHKDIRQATESARTYAREGNVAQVYKLSEVAFFDANYDQKVNM